MPNLLKQQYVVNGGGTTRIINSNEKILQLQKKNQIEQSSKNPGTEGFVEGIGGEQVPVKTPEDLIGEAVREAELILVEGKRKAEQLLKDAQSRAEQVRMRAMETGNREGLASAEDMLKQREQALEDRFQEMQNDLQTEYRQRFETMETQIVEAMITVFDKVLHTNFGKQKEILLQLVTNTIFEIENGKEFRLHINPEDAGYFQEHREDILERVGQSVVLEVITDPAINPMECTIETDYGIFKCGLEVQLSHLIEDIRTLSC